MAKKTNVMVGYSGELENILQDVLQDNLSPEAVAAVAGCLTPAVGKRDKVAREVTWFRGFLIEMLGTNEFNRMCDERAW